MTIKKIAGNNYITKENGLIYLDKVLLHEILKKSPTPMMIFLENKLRENLRTFKEIFQSVFSVSQCFYSFKANYLPEICSIIKSEGIGAEVISLPELKLALKVGFTPEKIIVGGPYLPKKLVEMSVKQNVKEIVVYNLKDLDLINSIAQNNEIVQKICIRVNSQKYNSRLGVILDEKNLQILKNVVNNCKHIKVTTILSHYGTQMNNIEQFRKNIKNIAENLKNLEEIGLKIDNINLGGGFPEATVMPQTQLKKIALNLKNIIEESKINYNNIYFEPGRYFVGDTGLFITEIINVYEDRWAFLNIGNHICPKFARCSLRFYNASQIDQPHKFKTSFAGILPTDQDVLSKDYFFTETLNEGEIILVLNVGGYCLTFSNRFPYTLPEIFIIKDAEVKKIFNSSTDGDFSIN